MRKYFFYKERAFKFLHFDYYFSEIGRPSFYQVSGNIFLLFHFIKLMVQKNAFSSVLIIFNSAVSLSGYWHSEDKRHKLATFLKRQFPQNYHRLNLKKKSCVLCILFTVFYRMYWMNSLFFHKLGFLVLKKFKH